MVDPEQFQVGADLDQVSDLARLAELLKQPLQLGRMIARPTETENGICKSPERPTRFHASIVRSGARYRQRLLGAD